MAKEEPYIPTTKERIDAYRKEWPEWFKNLEEINERNRDEM